MLVEALRYRSDQIADGDKGMLAGLADPEIGRVLRSMDSDTKRQWTLVAFAREAGMSRSSLALRFTHCRYSTDRISGAN